MTMSINLMVKVWSINSYEHID